MCDLDLRLVAWIDGELPEDEGATIEQHVQSCAECRQRVAAYKAASSDFGGYYSATTQPAPETQPPRKMPRWVPIACRSCSSRCRAFVAASCTETSSCCPCKLRKPPSRSHRSQRLNRWSKPSQ